MTAVWPSQVPAKELHAGYAEAPESNIAEFPVEVGPPKSRRRSSVTTALISFEQILSAGEYDALMDFWRDQLKDGVLPFVRVHPRTRALATFRFAAPPGMRALADDVYRVTLQLRQLP